MENKEFRNALIAAIKQELKDYTQIQKDLKKSRKEQYRPKGKYLQDIVDEINSNASKIQTLIFYYRWIKHGLKYWANRDIHNFKEYKFINLNDKGFSDTDWYYVNWDKVIEYGANKGKTHGEVITQYSKTYYINKCNEYGIEVTEANVNYLIQNV
jgi:hypothetical protein